MIIKGSVMELLALTKTINSIALALGDEGIPKEQMECNESSPIGKLKINFEHGIHIEIKEEFVLELYGLYARVGEKILPLLKPLLEAFGSVQEDIQKFVDKWE